MNEATARNIRVQNRYDELMTIGKHGHYETMFQVVREETESLRQQLTAALAAIKVKDSILERLIAGDKPYMSEYQQALTIQPDDSALKAWLGEPVAWMNIDPQGGALFFRNDVCHAATTPLYAPKGMK